MSHDRGVIYGFIPYIQITSYALSCQLHNHLFMFYGINNKTLNINYLHWINHVFLVYYKPYIFCKLGSWSELLEYPILSDRHQLKEEFEDIKVVIRIRNSKKNRQHNDQ
jgi:hypothetical protein